MRKTLFTTILLILLFSCGENRSENQPLIENAVDNTDSSLKGSFGSSRYEDNIIDKIYSELIKNDKKLSALDGKILKIHEEESKVIHPYKNIFIKSDDYYRDGKSQTNSITDSLMKHQIEKEIKLSKEKYDLKVKNIKALISQISKNTETINNLYTVFKIRKTLPEIEKYQNAHPLKADSLEHFIGKQNQLLDALKNVK
ncbi:hypothetical protein [Chryseobacterium hagamense]|uniref:Lipoprotein n=1 Tax=Chryseobacterium hagamense TaxID=395935 RepID=A0A511YHB7_9FLAO|nr:hypothetical protein [Chryseobacterium hagamense]GEN74602.1 hypothetical protein CHA01nite_03420 [Chryseobacterium hagamense]